MSWAALLIPAMLLDAVLGEPAWLWSRVPHPVVIIGRGVAALDHRLNHGAHRRAKGILACLLLAVAAIASGRALALSGPVTEVLVAAILLAQNSLTGHVRAVAEALGRSVPDGRQAVSRIVSRDCREMTGPQVARAAIESGAENLSDGVVAPAFWFLVGGLPGLILYKCVNTADSMIGYRNERYLAFGWAAARGDDLLNLIPARLTAVLIALLSRRIGSWPDIAADARRHRSPNAGWPEAAMARALGIALAGPRSYDGRMRDLAWVNGDACREIGPADINASVTLLWQAWAACLGLIVVIATAAAVV